MLNRTYTRISIAPLAIVAFLSGSAMAEASSITRPQRLAPQGSGFSILMPGTPTESVQFPAGEGRPTAVHRFVYTTPDGKESYFVGYSEYNFQLDVKATLDNVRNAEVGKGRLIWEQQVTLDGCQGRRITAMADDGHMVMAEFFISGSRLYLAEHRAANPLRSLNALPFLDSLHVAQ